MSYRVLIAENADGLEARVNAVLAEGGQLCGGVAICAVFETWENERKGYEEHETRQLLAQAVTIP